MDTVQYSILCNRTISSFLMWRLYSFPWAVVYKELGLFAFVEMMIFIAVLAVGLIYIWRKGDLEWVKLSVPYGRGRYSKLNVTQDEAEPLLEETAA